MPASVSAKIEKRQSSSVAAPAAPSAAVAAVAAENSVPGATASDNSSPIRQALVIIEHKIRNLEKRKAKLETYRDQEKSGKEINADMKVAVSKYGEVAQTLEFAREFSKQILTIATASEVEQKKKAKKEEKAKKQADIAKLREVLVMQDILSLLEDDVVRQDFIQGENGACKISQSSLEVLDKFYQEVTPRRPESHEETPFKTTANRAADHLMSTLELKTKPFAGEKETYAEIRNVLKDIQKCGYFDKAAEPPAPLVEETPVEKPAISEEINVEQLQEPKLLEEEEQVEQIPSEPDFQVAPTADAVPAPAFPQQIAPTQYPAVQQQQLPMLSVQHQQQQQQQQEHSHQQHIHSQQPTLNGPPGQLLQSIPLGPNMVPVVGVPATITVNAMPIQQGQNQPIHPGHLAPTTVHAVEQAYFKQHQYITQMRPLSEVINAQNFFFLQDSELDVCEVMAQPAIVTGFPPHSGQISPNMQHHQSNPNMQNQPQQQHLQQSQLLHQQQQHLTPNVRSPQQPPQNPPAFTNQSFPNVISGAPIFPETLKSGEMSQPHIPGFANVNAPIPIPLLTNQPPVQQQLIASQQQPQHNSVLQQQQSAVTATINNIIPTFPSQQQQQTGTKFLPSPIATNNTPSITNHPQQSSSSSLATVKINQSNKKQVSDVDAARVPEITEWKPEETVNNNKQLPDELSNEWQGQFFQAAPSNVEPEVSDWNEESPATTTTTNANATSDDSNNAWPSNGQQQRFPYRNHQGGGGGGYNGGRGNNNSRSGTAGVRNTNAAAAAGNLDSANSASNNNNGGYRNRPSYQTNGGGGVGNTGRQQQQSTTGGGGGGGGGGSGNGTFYRNNETYYQNGNSGGGGYRGGDKSGGGYRDNKQDGYRNNFRSRETSGNAGGARGTGGGLSGRSNNRYNSNSAERGQSTGSRPNANNPSAGTGARNGPSPVGGGQASRSVATTTKQHTVYGGGPRPSGARQTVNV